MHRGQYRFRLLSVQPFIIQSFHALNLQWAMMASCMGLGLVQTVQSRQALMAQRTSPLQRDSTTLSLCLTTESRINISLLQQVSEDSRVHIQRRCMPSTKTSLLNCIYLVNLKLSSQIDVICSGERKEILFPLRNCQIPGSVKQGFPNLNTFLIWSKNIFDGCISQNNIPFDYKQAKPQIELYIIFLTSAYEKLCLERNLVLMIEESEGMFASRQMGGYVDIMAELVNGRFLAFIIFQCQNSSSYRNPTSRISGLSYSILLFCILQ